MIKVTSISSGWPTRRYLDEIAESELKELSGQIFRAAVKLSPVYSGAFRASWRISFNQQRLDVTAGYSPSAPIRGAAFRWPRGFKLGDTIIISNNQPYAERVEYEYGYAPLRMAIAQAGMR